MPFWRRKPTEEIEETEAPDDTGAGDALASPDEATLDGESLPLGGASPTPAPEAEGDIEISDDELAAEAPAAGAPVEDRPRGWSVDLVTAADERSPGIETEAAIGTEASIEAPAAEATEAAELEVGLTKSRTGFMARLRGFLGAAGPEGPDWDDVEETLIAGDVGGALAMEIVERARGRHDQSGPEAAVRAELAALLVPRDPDWAPAPATEGGPAVILVVGVNGTGKTTTIGKLAARYHRDGQRVVLAAADTFRAAAIEQLTIWAMRADAEVVAHAPGADPGAVVYDALDAAIARRADLVIADTAGRLHTKSNLMDELAKIRRIVDKRLPGALPETLFVLDATTGQNGLAQARAFHEAVGLTGIVLTKLDSTAKGGIVFAIEDALRVPVRFVGVGEQADDLLAFDPDGFVAALFA